MKIQYPREQSATLPDSRTAPVRRAMGNSQLHIRRSRYDDGDYEAAVAIQNAIYPEHPQDVESWRYWDSNRDAKYLYRRYIGELDGNVVAAASLGHTPWSYKPGKFMLFIVVKPGFQRRGIGSAFYNHLMDDLAFLEPTKLCSWTREDHVAGTRFLKKRGFEPAMRVPVSRLHVPSFDPAPFSGKVNRVVESGIVIKSMAQLRDEEPDWKRKIYELEWECLQDVPTVDVLTKRNMEEFERLTLGSPRLLPDAWFVALDGDHYVGLSVLHRNTADRTLLETGLTGVVRSHRRRGIATALKVRAILYAKEAGAEFIDTDNEENNPMLQLNIQLGFEPQPAFVDYVKHLAPTV